MLWPPNISSPWVVAAFSRPLKPTFPGLEHRDRSLEEGGMVGKKQVLMPPAGNSLIPWKAVGFGCQRWKVQEGVPA